MRPCLTHRAACAALAAVLTLPAAAPAAAQSAAGFAGAEAAEAALARNLRILARDPRNFQALNAAGRAALDTGDTQTAAGFFGRAAEVSPRSWQPQAGMGAAMTAMGDPRGAMTYFAQAQAFGAPQMLIALDRGLAFDLAGDQVKAQSDYRVALAGAQSDEARRRLALSLAISRDTRGAMAMLDPLLRRNDEQALRNKAFILAMAGDRDGARRAIDLAMPGAGARFDPFFQIFPILRPEEKAAAVHLGIFPKDAAARFASAQPIPASPTVTLGGSRRTIVAAAPPPERTVAPKRKAEAKPKPAPQRTASAATKPQVVRKPFYSSMDPSRLRPSPGLAPARKPAAKPAAQKPQVQGPPPPAAAPAPAAPAADRLSGLEDLLRQGDGGPAPSGEPIVRIAEAETPSPGLTIDLPPPTPSEAAPTPVRKSALDRKAKAEAEKKARAEAERKARAEAEKKARAEAARIGVAGTNWVQIAGGAHKERMAAEYKRLSAKAGSVLTSRPGYVTEGKDYFRLLIGPFASTEAAQEYVRKLDKAGVDSFRWTRNPAQIRIEKLKT